MLPTPADPAAISPRRAALRELITAYAKVTPPTTITVVGNSPVPPDAERAALIDSSDLVVRMTSLALDTPDTEPALGKRCDVVVLHRGVLASPFTFADYTNKLYLLVEPGRLHWEPEELPHWWPRDLGFVPVSNYEFTVPLLELLGMDPAEPTWATTGTFAAYLFTELFPEATTRLTGMSIVDNPDQTTFQHAWGEPVHVTPEHRLQLESQLLKQWYAEGRIELLS